MRFMKIYDIDAVDYEDAIQYLIDDGIVGFNSQPSLINKIYDSIYENIDNYDLNDIIIVQDFLINNDNYIYFLRDDVRFTHDKAIKLIEPLMKKLYPKNSSDNK